MTGNDYSLAGEYGEGDFAYVVTPGFTGGEPKQPMG